MGGFGGELQGPSICSLRSRGGISKRPIFPDIARAGGPIAELDLELRTCPDFDLEEELSEGSVGVLTENRLGSTHDHPI